MHGRLRLCALHCRQWTHLRSVRQLTFRAATPEPQVVRAVANMAAELQSDSDRHAAPPPPPPALGIFRLQQPRTKLLDSLLPDYSHMYTDTLFAHTGPLHAVARRHSSASAPAMPTSQRLCSSMSAGSS